MRAILAIAIGVVCGALLSLSIVWLVTYCPSEDSCKADYHHHHIWTERVTP